MKSQDLRNSILQYAMEGRLISQSPNDTPVNKTIQNMKEDKELLVKEKVIRKEKALKPITDEEVPFKLPKSWTWVRLNDVAMYIQRGKSPKYSDIKKIPVVSQKCVQWSGFSLERARYIDPETVNKYDSIRFLKENDLLWNSTGLGTLGRIGIYKNDDNFQQVVADSHVTVIRTFNAEILSEFISYYLSSGLVQNNIESIASGTTKQKELNTSTIKNFIVPFPPLEEQKRIVKKVKELFRKVDNYDILEKKMTALNYGFPVNVEKSILQYAIRGKLLPQKINEGSAEDFLKKITRQKKQLIEQKIIKKEKDLPPIEEREKSLHLPQSWTWVRLGNCAHIKGGKRVPRGYKTISTPTPYIYLRVADMKNGSVNDNNLQYIDEEVYEKIKNYYIKKDDLYLTIAGTIGSIGEIPESLDGAILTENAVKISNIQIDKKFLLYLFKSPFIQLQIQKMITRVAQPKLSIRNIKSLVLPLPPLQEQKRIANKIEELLIQKEKLKSLYNIN